MTQLLDAPSDDALHPSIRPNVRKNRLRRRPEPWVGLLALLLGAGFLAATLVWNDGILFAPLDDVYIHLQYGRELGSGHFFEFNTGDGVSAGASSMLYAFILGGVYAIAPHANLLRLFVVAFGICCFAVSAALTCTLGTRLLHRTAGIWAGVLVAVSGPLLWGAASGMEVGVVMLLVVATTLTLVVEQPAARFRFTPVVAALLALARPEGLIFAAALTGAVLWTLWKRRRADDNGLLSTCCRSLWALLPLAFGAGQLLFYRLATGTASANGVQSKSMLNDTPVLYVGEFVDRVSATLRSLAGTFLGLTSQDFAFPGALLLCCVGAGYLLWQDRIRRPLVIAMLTGLAAAVLSLSTLDTALYHELRYFQPFLPLFLLFVVAGCHALCRTATRADVRRFALHGLLSVTLVFSLIAVPMWGVRYARAGAAIGGSDVSYAVWMKYNLPKNAVVAVKDVGAVAYLSDHHVVDLLGLGTNDFAKAANNGIGSLYERLVHLPEADRPGYFATYDTGPGPSMAPLRDAGVLVEPAVATFEVKTPPDLRDITAVPFRHFTVARADWSRSGSAAGQPVPGQLKDYLNIADLASEKDHDYTYQPAETGMQPWTVLAHDHDIIASGRTVVGGETFTAHGLTPGQPAVLTTRADIHDTHDLSVVVDGRTVGTWRREPHGGPWQYASFTIPADFVTGPAPRIELRQPQTLNPYPDYTAYDYWLTQ